MMICMNCKRTFVEPCLQYDDIGYPKTVCPYCESRNIEYAVACEQCSEWKPFDHYPYCDSCKDGAEQDTRRAIHILINVDHWDKELIYDIFEKMLNETEETE